MSVLTSRSSKLATAALATAVTGRALLELPGLLRDRAVIKSTARNRTASLPNKEQPGPNDIMIELGGHHLPVLKGGLFDRFRSNPPLAVIAEERPNLDLSWFETLRKEQKDVGFSTYSPNFYYDNSSITAIYTADMDAIDALIPEDVKHLVKPISYTPGYGLVAITSYAYHYCDNDTYNELSISIVTTKPDARNLGLLSLMGALKDKSLWGYVLKLPVDTELARVRGVVGYNLPKWLIPIEFDDGDDAITFTYFDEKGDLDFSMKGSRLALDNAAPDVTRSNFINVDRDGHLTHGHTDVRAIKRSSSTSAKDVELILTDGPLSTFIKSLGLKKLVRYDYQPEFQAALYTPEVIGNARTARGI